MSAETGLALTKRQITSLKQTLEDDIDISNELNYTDEQIEKLLKKLPVVMFGAAQQIVLALMDFKEAKRVSRKTFNNQMMKARLDANLTAAPDRKAWAENTQEFEDAEIDVIQAEARYRMAEYHYQAYDNLYTALKKMSAMRIEQNKAQDRATN